MFLARNRYEARIFQLWGAHLCDVLVVGVCADEFLSGSCDKLVRRLSEKFVSAECRNQHARDVRSPELEEFPCALSWLHRKFLRSQLIG